MTDNNKTREEEELYNELRELSNKMNTKHRWDNECMDMKYREVSIIHRLDKIDKDKGGVEGVDFNWHGSTKCWIETELEKS